MINYFFPRRGVFGRVGVSICSLTDLFIDFYFVLKNFFFVFQICCDFFVPFLGLNISFDRYFLFHYLFFPTHAFIIEYRICSIINVLGSFSSASSLISFIYDNHIFGIKKSIPNYGIWIWFDNDVEWATNYIIEAFYMTA